MFVEHVNNATKAAKLNKYIDSGKPVFMLIYMEGCGPCIAARPEWAKLEHTLGGQYGKKQPYKFIVADVNKNFAPLIHKIKQPNAFPSILYVSGDKMENYEDSAINDKRRDVDCFMNWIESHVGKMEVVSNYKETPKRHSSKKRKSSHKRRITGGRRYMTNYKKTTRRHRR
jgi:thiol-disulfide isomerase/thioredoxin